MTTRKKLSKTATPNPPATITLPYLAIKNWNKYQSSKTVGKPMPWIRDYCDQPQTLRLTMFQRALLQECRRLRGRLGKNLPNDIVWISRACSILPLERRYCHSTMTVLISKGYLIPVESENTSLEERRVEEKREEKRRGEPVLDGSSSSNAPSDNPAAEIPEGFRLDDAGDLVATR